MKLHSSSLFAMSAAAAVATTMVSSLSSVSPYLLTCQIETRFQFDGTPDGSPPATPSKIQLQNMGIDLMTTFQDAYVNNDGIDMLSERFSRFKMKRIKNPDFFDDDGDDGDDDEDLALFEAGLVDPEDVGELVTDLEDETSVSDETTIDISNVDREGNLRRGSTSTPLGVNDTEGQDSTIGENGPDDEDSTRLGIPGRAKRRRRRRRTRPPTRRPKPVYEKVKWDSNANFLGSVQCKWCDDDDDDRRAFYLTGSDMSSSDTTKNGSADESIPTTMGLGTANEHHEWETTFCGRLKATFPHATHCYISVSECNYGGNGGGGGNAAVLESGHDNGASAGASAGGDAHPHDGLTHYLVSDFMDQIPAVDVDAELDASAEDDGTVDEMVVYTVQALNPDQVSSVLLSSSPSALAEADHEA